MGAVGARAWSLLRRRVAATLALAAVIGLAGAVALAALAGANRGDRALPGFLARQDPATATFFTFAEDPLDDMAGVAADLRELPYVRQAVRVAPLVLVGPDGPGGRRPFLAYGLLDRGGGRILGDPIVAEGRLPDEGRADEVAVDEEFVERTGVGLGERYRFGTYRAAHTGDVDPSTTPPDGPSTEVRVVGVVRYPQDLVPARLEQDNVSVDGTEVYLTPGYWERYGPDLATLFGIGVGLHLDGGRDDLDRFRRDAAERFGEASFIDETDPDAGVAGVPLDGVRRAIDLETTALRAVAAVVTVAGLVLVGQALAREAALDAADDPVLAALGMTVGQRVAAGILRAAVPAVLGAALAVVGAVALSPLLPIGVARRAVLSPGVDVDGVVLGAGAALVVVLVCGAAAAAAWRATAAVRRAGDRAARPSVVARLVGDARLPVSGWTGLTLALERGRGGGAGLRRAGAVVAAVVVVAVTAAVAFAASLDHLNDEPADYGVTWDVAVGSEGTPEDGAALAQALREDGEVAAFTGVTGEGLVVGHDAAEVSALVVFDGPGAVGPRVVEGRAPEGPDEIAFGGQTLEDLGLAVGDEVEVRIGDFEPASLRITGRVLLNSSGLVEEVDNGRGALLPDPAQQRLVPPEDRALSFPGSFLVRFRPEVDREAAVARLERAHPRTVVRPLTPSEVDNLTRVSELPVVLAALVAVLGIATIVHVTVTTVRRRRRDLAMLSGLGFVRRQVSATLAFQATAVAVPALVLGLPLGVASGRWAWRLTADALWVVASPQVPVVGVVLVAAATLAMVNAAALGAGARARRTAPAAALRTE